MQLEVVKKENRGLHADLQEKEQRIGELCRIISDVHQAIEVLLGIIINFH